MTKAKIIDRIALTKSHSKHLQNSEKSEKSFSQEHGQLCNNNSDRSTYGKSKCPYCNEFSVVHEEGCMHCTNCGWSACG